MSLAQHFVLEKFRLGTKSVTIGKSVPQSLPQYDHLYKLQRTDVNGLEILNGIPIFP